ncbi:MAG: NTP transferase domain-containing protein [Rhodospirillaceae bacterium]
MTASPAGIVVFARMDSSRLPGKAMLPLGGAPMLAWTLRRCQAAGLPVSVATTDRAVDDPVVHLAEAEGLKVYRGDAADVLGRARAAAEAFEIDSLIRISGDSPFIDPALIRRVTNAHEKEKPDLTTNVFPRTFPPGISAEAIPVATLDRIMAATRAPDDREHVTKYVYEKKDEFRILNVSAQGGGYGGLHLAVDTKADYDRACRIINRISGMMAGLEEIAAVALRLPAEESVQ